MNDPRRYRLETAADRERDRFNEAFPLPELPDLGDRND